MLKRIVVATVMLAGAALALSQAASAFESRNPFGFPDIVAPDGPDVMQLAARIQMPGGPDDRNAPQWAEDVAASGNRDSLNGVWYSRWEAGTSGSSTVRVIGDRLYAT